MFSVIKWYCDSCTRTVEKVTGRLLQLELGQARLMDVVSMKVRIWMRRLD